jgi:transcriptional regulator with XRE-family HTH domain
VRRVLYRIHREHVNKNDECDMAQKQLVEIFAERLRAARGLRGLNQREVAERCGLPPSSIAHFEGADRSPSLENLGRLASALEVSTDYLLGRTASPVAVQDDDPLLGDIAQLGIPDRALAKDLIRAVATHRAPRRR